MSKKNKTSDSKSHIKKIKDKNTTVFSSNEVTLFDLEENVEKTNENIEEQTEEQTEETENGIAALGKSKISLTTNTICYYMQYKGHYLGFKTYVK